MNKSVSFVKNDWPLVEGDTITKEYCINYIFMDMFGIYLYKRN